LYISPVTLKGQGQWNPLLTVNTEFENNQSQSHINLKYGTFLAVSRFDMFSMFLFMSINVNSCRLDMPPGYIKSDRQHYTDTHSLIRALNIETPAPENGPISRQGPGGHSTHIDTQTDRDVEKKVPSLSLGSWQKLRTVFTGVCQGACM